MAEPVELEQVLVVAVVEVPEVMQVMAAMAVAEVVMGTLQPGKAEAEAVVKAQAPQARVVKAAAEVVAQDY